MSKLEKCGNVSVCLQTACASARRSVGGRAAPTGTARGMCERHAATANTGGSVRFDTAICASAGDSMSNTAVGA